jgi:hypothetical protein
MNYPHQLRALWMITRKNCDRLVIMFGRNQERKDQRGSPKFSDPARPSPRADAGLRGIV